MSGIYVLSITATSLLALAAGKAIPDFVAPLDEPFRPCRELEPETQKSEVTRSRTEFRRWVCGKVAYQVTHDYDDKVLEEVNAALFGLKNPNDIERALAASDKALKARACALTKKGSAGKHERRSFYECKDHRTEVSVWNGADGLTNVIFKVRRK